MHEIPKLERSDEMLCEGNEESSLRSDGFKHTPKSADADATPVESSKSTDAAPCLGYPFCNQLRGFPEASLARRRGLVLQSRGSEGSAGGMPCRVRGAKPSLFTAKLLLLLGWCSEFLPCRGGMRSQAKYLLVMLTNQ